MPVLLTPKQACTLSVLLREASTHTGVSYTLPNKAAADELPIQGLGTLSNAQSLEISFLSNPKLAPALEHTQAAAVILTPADWESFQHHTPTPAFLPVLCEQPYALYAVIAQWFDQKRLAALPTGIHETAIIHSSATIGNGVSVGPYAVIEAGAVIGDGSRIGAHCIIGKDSVLGKDCLLHAHVTLYHRITVGDRAILHSGCVLGADGFGFAPDPRAKQQAWIKIAQLGSVELGDDVEIGANTTVDRGALELTRLGHGVKLDNQIMIGHNCQVGDHTAMAACVGVAGSTKIGARCTIAGAAMLSGHLTLVDDVHVSGGTAITSDILEPGRYTGVFPYAEHRTWQKNAAVLAQIAELRQRLRRLERQASE